MQTEPDAHLLIGQHFQYFSEGNKRTILEGEYVLKDDGTKLYLQHSMPYRDCPAEQRIWGVELPDEIDVTPSKNLESLVEFINNTTKELTQAGVNQAALIAVPFFY